MVAVGDRLAVGVGQPVPLGEPGRRVLGATRLRHILAAGRVTSKTEAAGYALDTCDERWHRVAREVLRVRVGGEPLYRNPLRRRADLVGYLTDVLAG